jgi:hypothetical protein
MRTHECDASVITGRLAKARQFADAAHVVQALADESTDVADAFVTLAVHAGIAAADVICCVRLGRHARGENHNDAVDLLARVDAGASRHLRALLLLKTRAGYSATPVSGQDRVRAERAMDALIDLARTVA